MTKDIPGFIDLQVNGFLEVDYSCLEMGEEDFIRSCRGLLQKGTAAFLPTIITSPEEIYRRNLPMMAKIVDSNEFKNKVPGFHIEGPFLSPEPGARGAHNPDFIRKPDIDFLKRIIEWSDNKVKLLTVAAEGEGAEKLIEFASENGISVSLGHQMAGEDDIKRAADAGAKLLTHLGNGIPNTINRHRNPLWAGLSEERLKAMIITDGHHLPASLIKVIFQVKGAENVIVTSDASPLAGCAPGKYRVLGNNVVLEENGYLHNPEIGYMVGSSATMRDCMKYLESLGFLSEKELLEAGFYNPMKIAGIDLQP